MAPPPLPPARRTTRRRRLGRLDAFPEERHLPLDLGERHETRSPAWHEPDPGLLEDALQTASLDARSARELRDGVRRSHATRSSPFARASPRFARARPLASSRLASTRRTASCVGFGGRSARSALRRASLATFRATPWTKEENCTPLVGSNLTTAWATASSASRSSPPRRARATRRAFACSALLGAHCTRTFAIGAPRSCFTRPPGANRAAASFSRAVQEWTARSRCRRGGTRRPAPMK